MNNVEEIYKLKQYSVVLRKRETRNVILVATVISDVQDCLWYIDEEWRLLITKMSDDDH